MKYAKTFNFMWIFLFLSDRRAAAKCWEVWHRLHETSHRPVSSDSHIHTVPSSHQAWLATSQLPLLTTYCIFIYLILCFHSWEMNTCWHTRYHLSLSGQVLWCKNKFFGFHLYWYWSLFEFFLESNSKPLSSLWKWSFCFHPASCQLASLETCAMVSLHEMIFYCD